MDHRNPDEMVDGPMTGLSNRERQLLLMAASGHTDQSIANHLGISLATVGTYWGRVRIKLGPFNRTELVANYLKSQAEVTVASLKQENRQLIDDLDHKVKTEAALRASVEMFRGLLDHAPDAILIVNEKGRIEFANKQAARVFGYTGEEMIKMHVEDLVPVHLREAHVQYRLEYNSRPETRPMGNHLGTLALRKDGSQFHMATALSGMRTPRGLWVTCIVRDLTESLSDLKPA
jgi:PAS domain S-box-containing protein